LYIYTVQSAISATAGLLVVKPAFFVWVIPAPSED